MKNYQFGLFACFLFLSFSINAQDIVRTKKDTIRAKVVEIGIEEIKYKDFNNLEGPVFVLPKTDVIEITYENGTKTLLKPDEYDVTEAATAMRKKTRAVKYEFLSPLGGDLVFGYETLVKVGMNLEFKVGLIGVGFGENAKNASGASFKAGVKFLTRPNYVQRGVKYAHGLAGFYIKPEVIFNSYKKDEEYYNYNVYPYTYGVTEVSVTNYALNIVLGKQYILGNSFSLDIYGGIGYGIRSSNEDTNLIYNYDNEASYEYSHTYGGSESPIVFSGGFALGVLF
jgi:hypothetical protein